MNQKTGCSHIKALQCLGLLLFFATITSRNSYAQEALLSTQEVLITNNFGASITVTLIEAPDTVVDGPETLSDGAHRSYQFTGNGGANFNGKDFTKYIYKIDVDGV